ncbi:MAG: dTDP-4-dehydrorhamnose reductase [Lachnospiraceae bacterium]|jgi:dTDP-4-dehydrorhamnose reductase|nr:dTDP-4-dehydrorhamnose reductase [Lachnospiraceae bacterium]
MKKILVTGCNGQLGRAINQEYGNEAEFINTDVQAGDGAIALDITKVEDVLALVRETKPDVIINCAAHTAVDLCEQQWDSAYRINAIGPRNLSIAASEVDAKLIHVSTDYVFDGNGSRPYTEFDAPGPNSAYGKTKLEGENFVKAFAGKYFILRTAWLYGDGKNFVKTMLRLSESHDKVTVVDDQVGCPTSASELAKMIHFLEPTENYGLFHAVCEGSCSWADLAEETFKLAGKNTVVERVSTEEYCRRNPGQAPRPAYSILDDYMIKLTSDFRMADWKDALKVYLSGNA